MINPSHNFKLMLLFFTMILIASCQPSDNILNDPVKYTYQIAFYAIVLIITIVAIVVVAHIFNNLPEILVRIIWILIIVAIIIFSLGVLLTCFVGICYAIVYKGFWLHTEGFFVSLGGIILGLVLSVGVFSLFYYLFYKSPIGKFIENLFLRLDSWDNNISEINDIYTFFESLKNK